MCIICTSQINVLCLERVGGHSDLEIRYVRLITAAGQCRIYTELSPLRPMAAPHQNRQLYVTLP
jgi:hypothetical protein